MTRPRTVGVSLTPEAREALNDLVVDVITATQMRVSQSDALRVAALSARAHPTELRKHLASVLGTDETALIDYKINRDQERKHGEA